MKKYFTEDARKRMLELVNNLQKAFAVRLDNLDWMSDSTKQKAKEKLFAFTKKIGYPDKWRDYSNVNVTRDKYFENVVSAAANNYQYQLAKLDKPVDKTEWFTTPSTVTAYYNPFANEIVFPAGILQTPYFDDAADDALNYGGIPILQNGLSPLRQYELTKSFVRFVNDWMKHILENVGINKKATTYVARHTFSTVLKRSGASTEFINKQCHKLKIIYQRQEL